MGDSPQTVGVPDFRERLCKLGKQGKEIMNVRSPLRRLALVPEPHSGESLLSWVDALARLNQVSRPMALRMTVRFPRDARKGDRRSDSSHERRSDDACPEEVPA
ncbi:hypothetical protein ABT030_52810, partial [Streptomyces mirabilis]|uniref:hypothetical protein n=1 Tax=Streptomyces mirabilis TaxID=68239 RepID=UPI0033260D22